MIFKKNKPKIFTLNCRCWIGSVGKKSFRVEQPKCLVCGRDFQEEIEYSKIQLEIEKYNGEDMVGSQSSIFVVVFQSCIYFLQPFQCSIYK